MQRALGEVIQKAAPRPIPRINLVPCSKRCILPIYEHRVFLLFFFSGSQSGWTFPEMKKDHDLAALIPAKQGSHECY